MSLSASIPVLVRVGEPVTIKEAFGKASPAPTATEIAQVSPDALSRNIASFLERFQPVLDAQPDSVGRFQIEEYEISLSVNAEGGVSLIGQVKAGATASIKVKLKRRAP